MVNRNNRVEGRNVSRHPLMAPGLYIKGVTVLAKQAQQGGVLIMDRGEVPFHAGDYIVTDIPPTHAWTVNQQVFESTYELFEVETDFGNPIEDAEELKTGELADPEDVVPQADDSVVSKTIPEVTKEPKPAKTAKGTSNSESLKALG